MGLFGFGGGDDQDSALDDAALIKAARRRLLKMLEQEQASGITNNVYGGGQPSHGASGFSEQMHGASGEDPNLFDYLVDIEKKDIPGENGKPIGWSKKVHRYRTAHDEKKK